MRTIISTGQGRLHLIDSAVAIKKAGVNVRIITGWVPSRKLPDKVINFLGQLIGRKNIAYGLRKRFPEPFESKEIKTCSFAEIFNQLLLFLSRLKIIDHNFALTVGWGIYGYQSKKYLKNADIFHVRTGAGQGGAIKRAKKSNIIVLADQSAAHPNEIYLQLSKAYRNMSNPFDPNTGLWKLVLEDCKNADYILVNSEYIKRSFIENGFNERTIFVIPLGIRSDFFGLKTNYHINNEVKIIYTGSISRWKGFHLIVEVVKELIQDNFPFLFHVFGTISSDVNIPDWFLQNPRITMHNYVPQDELKCFLSNSDLYIFPSYCDGGSQALREAMAVGLPVITNEKTGSQIVHGENGWIVSDDSSEEILEAIYILSKNEGLRKKLGQSAANTIKTNHTWESYGEKVMELYSLILNEK